MAGPQVTATKVAGIHRSARSTVCVQLPQPAPTTSNKVVSRNARVQRLEMPRAESSPTIYISRQRAVNNTPPWSNDSCFFKCIKKAAVVEIGNQQIRYLIIGYKCFVSRCLKSDMIQPTVGALYYFPWCP